MNKTTATTSRSAMRVDLGISAEGRQAISDGLSRVLADTYTLYLTTHNFHWNVTGPMFNSLHAMFMEQYTELWNAVDPIAERIRSLGHVAPGSYAAFGKLSSLPDAPLDPPKAMEMVRMLMEGHEAVARTARGLLPTAEEARDEPTSDLLVQRLTVHEQTAWMLRSLLEE
jgi:starvation-inducible DNA-binding protein